MPRKSYYPDEKQLRKLAPRWLEPLWLFWACACLVFRDRNKPMHAVPDATPLVLVAVPVDVVMPVVHRAQGVVQVVARVVRGLAKEPAQRLVQVVARDLVKEPAAVLAPVHVPVDAIRLVLVIARPYVHLSSNW